MRVGFNGGLPVMNRPVDKPVQFAGYSFQSLSLGNPLLDAIANNNMAEFKKQLDSGTSPNTRTKSERTAYGSNGALQVAIIYARLDMVKALLSQPDIDLTTKNAYRETPLQTAQRQVDRKNTKFVQDPPDKHQRYVEILDLVTKAVAGENPVDKTPEPPETPPAEKPGSDEPFSPAAKAIIENELGPRGYRIVAAFVRTLEKLGIIERRS